VFLPAPAKSKAGIPHRQETKKAIYIDCAKLKHNPLKDSSFSKNAAPVKNTELKTQKQNLQ